MRSGSLPRSVSKGTCGDGGSDFASDSRYDEYVPQCRGETQVQSRVVPGRTRTVVVTFKVPTRTSAEWTGLEKTEQ